MNEEEIEKLKMDYISEYEINYKNFNIGDIVESIVPTFKNEVSIIVDIKEKFEQNMKDVHHEDEDGKKKTYIDSTPITKKIITTMNKYGKKTYGATSLRKINVTDEIMEEWFQSS